VKASGFGWQAQSRRCLVDSSAITICEAVVPSTRITTFGVLLAIFMAWPASAQDSTSAPVPGPAKQVLTGKERLGKKWTDEQRIDNCNVPIDKRGTKPRPVSCPHLPTS
jgi:hypothetical protein